MREMKYYTSAIVAAAALFGAVPASAQTFQGPYVGVAAGWNQDKIGTADSKLGRLDMDEKSDRFFAGGFAGYDQMITPHILVGLEAGFDFAADDAAANGAALIDPNYSFDVGARAGYVFNEKTLVYVRGSYENMRARIMNETGAGVTQAHDNFDGWGIGAGVEREVMDHVSARIEYRYSDLGSGGTFDRHQALMGIAYHF
jgi:outer membrane immunogenic protein